jgi:shikimate dehydrogenase
MIINSKTILYGIIGNPISNSLSPNIYNNLFEYYNLNKIYLAFLIKEENLDQICEYMKALNIKGLNITAPYKEKIIKYVDRLDSNAKIIGAVNTLTNKNGVILGSNTDGIGFIESLKDRFNFDFYKKNVLIFGAGGAAKAIIFSLTKNSVGKITIKNRTIKKIPKTNFVIEDFNSPIKNIEKYDLIINATSIDLDIKLENANRKCIVYDIFYKEKETKLIKLAKKYQLPYLEGKEMLVYQARYVFKIWTGIFPDIKLIKKVLEGV